MPAKLRQDWIDRVRDNAAKDRLAVESVASLKAAEVRQQFIDDFMRDRLAYLTARWQGYEQLLPEDIPLYRAAYIAGAGMEET